MPFQVSNLAMFNLETDENLNIYVVNRETGLPMSFVTAHFTEYAYSYDTKSWGRRTVADVICDRNGFLTAPITRKNSYFIDLYDKTDTLLATNYSSYHISHKNDNLEIKVRFSLTAPFTVLVRQCNSTTLFIVAARNPRK